VIVYGIDPGPVLEDTAIVAWDTGTNKVWVYEGLHNLAHTPYVFCESMSPIGAVLAQVTIDTLVNVGRIVERLHLSSKQLVTRRDVKRHLLGKVSGNDAQVRMALEERFGPKGVKANPGPLYGIKGHHLAALAVAVTGYDTVLGGKG